ncbi:MAG TPA: M1 family aminopeptidase [Gemmatimonadales bacterium]|nr:M1 family aminopeptidase [Gemmatimonadales bacterium]
MRKLITMKRAVAVPLLLAALAPSLAGQAVEYLPTFDSLRSLSLRADSAASLRDVTLVRDSLVFHLDSGTLYFSGTVMGRVIGVAFVGRGSVSVAPAYSIERRELRRVLHDSSTTWAITAAAFLALDSSVTELKHHATGWHPGQESDARHTMDHLLSHVLDGRSKLALDADFLAGILNADTTGYLLARVARPSGADLTFRYDARASEGLAVLHDGREGAAEWPIAAFPIARALSDSEPEEVADPDVRMGPYTVKAVVDPAHDFSSITVFRFTTPRVRTRWVEFQLAEELNADSLGTADGRPVPYFQAPHNGNLWIRLPDGRQPGDTVALRLVDHGALIGTYSLLEGWRRDGPRIAPEVRPDKWLLVRDCSEWYPRYGYSQATDMDLTYRVPQEYQFSSIGRLVDSARSGDTAITHWRTERPTVWACFNVGRMDERHIADPRIPPVVVQMNTEAHKSLDQFLEALTDSGGSVSNLRLLTRADALTDVTGDVANSLSFFTQRFGTPLYSRYYATEVPFDYGQAFPGMIYLSNYTYIGQRNTGAEEVFRSHEMAHQWWGIGIMPAGERDAWLQEGFANFSALWYMQQIMNDTSKFFDQITKWRDDLLRRGPDVAPLGIGFRVANQDHPGDYDLIVYEKGAWVLQMLRNLMLNFRTFNEDGFTATMRDFYMRFRGQKASIRDFERVVEQHSDVPMGWFFDEWVDRSAIPTYTFSWQADTAVNGKTPVHFRVRQEDVPGDFFMPVPVELQFAGNRHVYMHLNVRGPLTEGTLNFPETPTAVFFDPLASVLAKVKTEHWKR